MGITRFEMRERVIKLFYNEINSDVREELMDTIGQVCGHEYDIIDDITEDHAQIIYDEIKSYAEQDLTIQGEDPKPMLQFLIEEDN